MYISKNDIKQDLMYFAKMTELSERYEDMTNCMKKIVALGDQLSFQCRRYLSVAFRNLLSPKKRAWRSLCGLEEKSLENESKYIEIIRQCKKKIQQQYVSICKDVIDLLDQILIPGTENVQSKVFYYKMKGDYCRYYSQVCIGSTYNQIVNNAQIAYVSADKLAKSGLSLSNSLRLQLYLNFCVFYYQVKSDTEKAINLAKQTYEQAFEEVEEFSGYRKTECSSLLQLIKDNWMLWRSETSNQT